MILYASIKSKERFLLYFYIYYFILPFVAPASPPEDFDVTDSTPNTISLSWSPPLEGDINGIIDNYIIRYYITEQLGVDEVNDTVNVMVVPATPTTTTLMGLGNYTVYDISVSAVTVGEGPNTSLSQRTAQNGMMLLKLDTTAPLVLFLVTSFCSTILFLRLIAICLQTTLLHVHD